jgi:peptidoglycan/LPS O-acetylase OafA/YrhL
MINDSLWSLSYEFTMYMSLLVFYFIKNKKTALFGVTFTFITFYFLSIYKPLFLGKYFQLFNLETNRLYHLAMIFLAGSALTFFNLSKINYLSIRILCAISLLIILYLGWYNILSSFILPLLILLVGQIATPILSTLGEKVGDISYGVYIYGFIIQQILMNYFSFSPIQLMSLSLPITFAIAYFSWHLIEKKMMKYKELI